jgi:hypothetical protein
VTRWRCCYNVVIRLIITPNLRRGRDEKLPLLSQFHFTGKKLWIVVGKQSQGHEKNKVKLVYNYYRLFFSRVRVADLVHLKLAISYAKPTKLKSISYETKLILLYFIQSHANYNYRVTKIKFPIWHSLSSIYS